MNNIMRLIGDFEGETLERWRKWAELNDFTIEHTTLDELESKVYGKDGHALVILDGIGLNHAPLPQHSKVQIIIDTVIVDQPRRALVGGFAIHASMAAVLTELASLELPAIRQEYHSQRAVTCEPMPTNRRRSKGERKGNRKYRWC